jgi:hypothetical protein
MKGQHASRLAKLEAAMSAPRVSVWEIPLDFPAELLTGEDRELQLMFQQMASGAAPGDDRNDIDFQLEALEALPPVAGAQEPAPVPGRLPAGLKELADGERRATTDEAERP